MGRRKRIEDDALLAIAREVFVERGFAATTREVARRAGISEAAIYQRHPTKTHLFFSAMVPPALDVEALLAATGDEPGVSERLERIALDLLEYFREVVPVLLPLATHPEFDLEAFAEWHERSPFRRIHGALVEFLEVHRDAGRVGPGDAEPPALALMATLHSLAFLERLGVHGGRFGEEVVRAIVRSLWRGLAPTPSPPAFRSRRGRRK